MEQCSICGKPKGQPPVGCPGHYAPAIRCHVCRKEPSVCTPVVEIPIKNTPRRMRLQATFGLCNQCAFAFTLNKFTDYDGAWYDMACDQLRAYRVAGKNPFPDDPDFNFQEFLINPDYDPVPKEQCVLKFWRIETLMAKGMSERIDLHRR